MNEREFIIKVAIDAFNKEFGTNHEYQDCDAFSLPHGDYDRCLFEVYTKKHFDALRIRLSCQMTNRTWVGPFRLVLSVPTIINGLGDEVWYANVQLDQEFLFAGMNYVRRVCPVILPKRNTVLIAENGDGILTEDGDEILISDD